jgi:SNF2 family DNA or RNA helicase
MGLGKTVISICAVEELVETDRVSSGLVIVPASLKYQWAEKIEEFTGDDNYIVIDGTPSQRAEQYSRAEDIEPRYVILNYEKVRDEFNVVRRLRRDYIITDEATVYKSFKAKISKRIKRLQEDVEYHVGLTGQPIENQPEDLFSIMEGVDDEVLGRWDYFDRTFIERDYFGRVKRVRNLPLLWERMGDAMVRKTRHDDDVAPYMPQVEESGIPIEFDRAGAKLYRYIVADLQIDLARVVETGGNFDLYTLYSGGDEDGNSLRGSIMSKLTCLRMLCDHPDLLRISAEKYYDEDTRLGSEYAAALMDNGLLDPLKQTPKMQMCLDVVTDLLHENPLNKVVIFSTFKPTLTWLQNEFAYGSVLFTGDMNAKEKDVAKRRFGNDPKVRLFLSSDAGGYGVDLPNANYLFNYDLPWSAGKHEQRNARIIRLSSEWDKVMLYNLTMRGSIEQRQYEMLVEKKAIAAAMIDKIGANMKMGDLSLTLDSLSEFLDLSEV